MNIFAQRLNRLRCCTYSTLLRLSKQRSYSQQLVRLPKMTNRTLLYSEWTADLEEYNDPGYLLETMKENQYARNFFLNSYKYRKSVMLQSTAHANVNNERALKLLNENWNLKTNAQLLSDVKMLGYNICYGDKKIEPCLYRNLFITLNDRQLNDNDLMTLIRYLTPFREHLQQQDFYQQFCIQLNFECVKRFMQLSIDDTLKLCDMIFEMTHSRKCEYIWHAIRKFGNKPHKLEPHHLIQVLFFLNVCRKPPLNMYELEYHLEKCFDELSINELSIAALGFFKTSTRIRSTQLLRRIIQKTIENMEHMNTVSIGALAKLIRYSMQLTEINNLKKLIDALLLIESRLTLMTLNHIAHASTRVTLYHEEFMNKLIERSNNEIQTVRIKDLERIVYFLAIFNVDRNNSVYHNVIQELRNTWYTKRALEIQRFPLAVSRILGYLSYVNLYPTDLIERIMTPEFLHMSCNGSNRLLSREFFVLDNSLQVEMPQYNGPFLPCRIRKYMLKTLFLNFKSPESSKANLLLMDVMQTCQEMFNNTSDIVFDRPLPHHMIQDIILGLNEENQLVPNKNYPTIRKEGDIKWMGKEDEKNIRWIALIMAYHGVLIKDTNLPTGLFNAKIRQLTKIGYTPIMVSYIKWQECNTQEMKQDYIKQLLFSNNTLKST